MDNYNTKIQHYKPEMVAKKYYKLDTTTDPNKTATIPALNGRQGDAMRAVNLAFVDDGEPHDLTDTQITLKVLDAAGVVKTSDKVINLVDASGGLVVFGVPAAVYQSPGEVQRAYFVLKDKTLDGSQQVISTVNVDFNVLENGIDISQANSDIYISALDKVISSAGNVVTAGGDNHFTGSNVIDTLTVKKLINSDVENLKQQASSQTDQISDAKDHISSNTAELSTLSEAVSNVQDVANSNASSASVNSVSISAISDNVSHVSQSLRSLSNEVDNLSSAVVQTGNNDGGVSSVADDLSDAMDSLNSLSERVEKVSGVDSLTSYSIAVNSTMTATISQAVKSFIVQYNTNSEVYNDSALRFLGSFLVSAQTQYNQKVGEIH